MKRCLCAWLTALFLSCATTLVVAASSSPSFTIEKPVAGPTDRKGSGDNQAAAAGETLGQPLRVIVRRPDGAPAAGRTVYFAVVMTPPGARGAVLGDTVTTTDREGVAQTSFRMGSEPGTYVVSAAVDGGRPGAGTVFYSFNAWVSDWPVQLVIGVLGGLGIFLYGMRLMSGGMRKTAARRMRSILSRLTHNRFVALAAGAFVTMVVQSSSVTTVMLVSFVKAGLMTFAQSVGIILGADVGTTVTAQLIAFKLSDFSLLFIALGMALMLISRSDKPRDLGETILGFGLLFFGMHIMSVSMVPLRTHETVIRLLVSLENPVLGILIGMTLTALIQSSGAFAGILIVLATQGLLTLEASIPLLFGANVGTCVTAFLATVGAQRDARRVAVAHTAFKLVGVLVFVWWIPQFADLVRWLSPKGSATLTGSAHLAQVLPRQIANAHTVFNVALTAAILPFTNTAVRVIERFLPDKPSDADVRFRTRYLDRTMLSVPPLALNLAKAEVLRMGAIVETMVEKIILPFVTHDEQAIPQLEQAEQEVDYLDREISAFLTQISQQSLEEERINEVFQMMYTVTELEQIGDIVTKNLLPRARGWVEDRLEFSPEGRAEIEDYHNRTVKQLSRGLSVFRDLNLEAASRMKRKQKKYRAMEEQYIRAHFERIRRDVRESLETSETHQDLMEQFRRITSHSTRIARTILSWSVGPRLLEGPKKNPPEK